jgi:hypothetical protein
MGASDDVFGPLESFPRHTDPRFGESEKEVVNRRPLIEGSDELAHVTQTPVDAHNSLLGDVLTGEESKHCGLPYAVGADQGDVLTARNLEGEVVEKNAATGQREADVRQFDVSHEVSPEQ